MTEGQNGAPRSPARGAWGINGIRQNSNREHSIRNYANRLKTKTESKV